MAGSHPALAPGNPVVPWFLRSASRLLTTLLLGIALPLGVFTAAAVLSSRQVLEEQAIRQNTAAARLGAEAVEAHFEGLRRYVESYARRPEVTAAFARRDEEAVRRHLIDLIDGNPRLDRCFLTDAEGIELFDWPRDPDVIGKSFAFRDWYKGVSKSGRTYVSEVYRRAAAPRHFIVAIATPVSDDRGQVMGYLVGQHTIHALTGRIAGIKPAEVGGIALVDHRAHLAIEGLDVEADPLDMSQEPLILAMLAGREGSLIEPDPLTHEPSLLSYARSPSIGWVVVAQQPIAAVHAPARALQNAILGLSALCLAGMLALGFFGLNAVRHHHVASLELQGLKDVLGGMVVHDLRNPLTSLMLSLDLVRERSDEQSDRVREDVERARHSAKRLGELVNTLLDIMRMEEKALVPSLAVRDLASLATAKADEYRAMAESRSIALAVEIAPGAFEASVDEGLLGRVIDNLLINALKHTPGGGRVALRLDRDEARRRCRLVVADTGEGIAPEDLPRLFHKYGRAQQQKLGRQSDTGLGLVFCRMAVELMGGSIEVESAPGRGSEFRVLLPLAGADQAPAHAVSPRVGLAR